MSKVLITYERGNNTTDVNLASFRLLFSHMSIQWREKKTTLVSHSDLLWWMYVLLSDLIVSILKE